MKVIYKHSLCEVVDPTPDIEGKILIVDGWDNYWCVHPCELKYLDEDN